MIVGSYERERRIAGELAMCAGTAIRRLHRRAIEVTYKAGDQPVTDADVASNRIVVDGLQSHFPDDGVLSEESGRIVRPGRERVWIVDPLDGTKQFLRGSEDFVVMIGLVEAGIPVVGAIYQPLRERLWIASRGGGAELCERGDRRPMRVSDRTRTHGQMRLVVVGSHSLRGLDGVRADMGVSEVLRIGSLGLKVSTIASGDAELFVQVSDHMSEWDCCAADVVLSESGGKMTDAFGQPLRYDKVDARNRRGIIASNGPDHEFVARYVRPWVEHARLDMQ